MGKISHSWWYTRGLSVVARLKEANCAKHTILRSARKLDEWATKKDEVAHPTMMGESAHIRFLVLALNGHCGSRTSLISTEDALVAVDLIRFARYIVQAFQMECMLHGEDYYERVFARSDLGCAYGELINMLHTVEERMEIRHRVHREKEARVPRADDHTERKVDIGPSPTDTWQEALRRMNERRTNGFGSFFYER